MEKSAEILHEKTAVNMLSDRKNPNFEIWIVFTQYIFYWYQLLLKTGYFYISIFPYFHISIFPYFHKISISVRRRSWEQKLNTFSQSRLMTRYIYIKPMNGYFRQKQWIVISVISFGVSHFTPSSFCYPRSDQS